MKIGIDLMGSDQAPLLLLESVKKYIEERACLKNLGHKSVKFTLFLTKKFFESIKSSINLSEVEVVVASEEVTPDDSLFVALRKKESTVAIGLKCLKNHTISAFVTPCQTAVLTGLITRTLPLFAPILTRPALIASLPSMKDPITVLDVGANLTSSASQLLEFAKLGLAYHQVMYGQKNPKVGLLNIGEEAHKGKDILKAAFQLLQKESYFIGNVQGREIFRGVADVVITEGFTGNIFLKTAEGVASFILESLEELLRHSPEKVELTVLERARKQFDYMEYPGAFFAGVEGVVVKCHGNAAKTAFVNCIKGAEELLHRNIVDQMKLLYNRHPLA